MAETTYYSLKDLIAAAVRAEGSALNEQTVRHYIAEGVLPAAPGRAIGGRYGEEQLSRLRLAIRLAAQYVPLKEIVRYLDRLSPAALRMVLDRPLISRSPSEGDAHAYMERLFRGVRLEALRQADPPASLVSPGILAPAPRPRRTAATAKPLERSDYSEWLHLAIDPDVELLVRGGSRFGQKRQLERLAAVLREALAADTSADH